MGFGKNNTGAIIRSQEGVALGTLGDVTAIKMASEVSLEEDFRLLKMEILGRVGGLTSGEGVGLCLGIANGELSVAEIGEALLVDGPSDRNDRLKQERAERFVKLFASTGQGQVDIARNFIGEGGSPLIVVKPRWTFSNPEGWDLFVWNHGGSALQTGAVVDLTIVFYGVWLT